MTSETLRVRGEVLSADGVAEIILGLLTSLKDDGVLTWLDIYDFMKIEFDGSENYPEPKVLAILAATGLVESTMRGAGIRLRRVS